MKLLETMKSSAAYASGYENTPVQEQQRAKKGFAGASNRASRIKLLSDKGEIVRKGGKRYGHCVKVS